jgi:hypothetical protein
VQRAGPPGSPPSDRSGAVPVVAGDLSGSGPATAANQENGIILIEEGTYPSDHNIGNYQGRWLNETLTGIPLIGA